MTRKYPDMTDQTMEVSWNEMLEIGKSRRQKIHDDRGIHFWLITKEEDEEDTERSFACEFCKATKTERKMEMKLNLGSKVKLTEKFGLVDGENQFPDSTQRGKLATITGFDGYGYELIVDGDDSEYGGIEEEWVEHIN